MAISNGDMPAMPVLEENNISAGMTKREQFAAMAMQGLLSNNEMGDAAMHDTAAEWVYQITSSSVEFADALLKELGK